MNILEGASRMQRAGRALVILSLSAFALSAILAVAGTFLPSYVHVSEFLRIAPILFVAVWFCATGLLIGGVLWIAGWILEGFAHHTH